MMSYLWILLLGSLLASHAKAQDDENPADVPEDPADGEDEDMNDDTSETPQMSTPESTTEPDPNVPDSDDLAADEDPQTATPAYEGPEQTTAAEVGVDPTTAAEAEAEQTTAAEAEADQTTAAEGEADQDPAATTETPVDDDSQTEAPTGDLDGEVVATTEGPDVDPEGSDAELPTDKVKEELSTTPAEDEGDLANHATVEDSQEEPTDPARDEQPTKPVVEERIVPKGRGFNLEDALEKDRQANNNPQSGKSVSDSDVDAAATNSDEPETKEGSSSPLAAVVTSIVVAAVGAVAGYFTYQKKKLCFKNRQEADPEAPHKADATEAQADPQASKTLLEQQ